MTNEIYLDNAATTRVCEEAAQAALEAMVQNYGNPSSTHTKGRQAKTLLDASREAVASALGCRPTELVFTSCGSESDNWALLAGADGMKRKGKHIVSSTVEHDAIRKTLDILERQGYEVTRLAPEKDGSIAPGAVRAALRPDTILVSLMMVNNETGAVTDIAAVSQIIKESGAPALLHCDAVQGFLKVPFAAKTLGADLLSISGHKIHAPKGIGALYIREGLRLTPFIAGGTQEKGRRAGTEAMPQIAAFAEAAKVGRILMSASTSRMKELRAHAVRRLTGENPGLVLIGGGAPHILSISLPGYRSEVLMNFLEAQGIYVSRSSACKKGARSHVLEGIGLPTPVIEGALRIGLSRYTTPEEIDAFCDALKSARETLAHR